MTLSTYEIFVVNIEDIYALERQQLNLSYYKIEIFKYSYSVFETYTRYAHAVREVYYIL